jgi:hypothetical protein
MNSKTLYLLITCSKEQTRHQVLDAVVKNLSNIMTSEVNDNLIVFDNQSTVEDSIKILSENFKNVYQSRVNLGYWSALNWCLENYQTLLNRQYKYVYIIESDLIHTDDAFSKIKTCEDFLDKYDFIGFVRTEEFSVKNRHLYDKDSYSRDSKTYAWTRQFNSIEGRGVEFMQSEDFPDIYACNFLAKLPALSRLEVVKNVFSSLKNNDSFSEQEYQKLYYKHHQVSALIDGGIFHSKLTNENVFHNVNGSHNFSKNLDYHSTRCSKISLYHPDDVIKITTKCE